MAHGAHRRERLLRLLLLGGYRQRQAVDPHVLPGDAASLRRRQDSPSDGHPLRRRGRQALLVQGQAHHRRAVLLHQRQHRRNGLRLAVDGVHRGLAVVHTQACLQRLRVGGIQLQRQIHRRLQPLDHPGQHGLFVHAGIAHVHVQDLRARVLLLHRHIHNVVQVVLQQRLLEALLARGVDALADDPHAADSQGGGGCADEAHRVVGTLAGLHVPDCLPQRTDISRVGAAAAAHQAGPGIHQCLHGLGEILRRQVVMAVHRIGQARVGLGDHRQAGGGAHLLHHGQQLHRPQRAVHAHRVRPQALQRPGHGGHRASREGTPPLLEAHGHQGGQAGILLHRQQRGLGLVQVGHGFDGGQVSPGLRPRHGDLPENIHRFLKRQRTQGLQQRANGPHVQPHQAIRALRGLSRGGHGGMHHLRYGVACVRQLQPVGPEGIGIDDAAPRVDVLPVDSLQQLRSVQRRQLRQLAGAQTALLQHGAHGAIQQDNMLLINHHSVFLLCAGRRFCSSCNRHSPGCGPFAACPPGR